MCLQLKHFFTILKYIQRHFLRSANEESIGFKLKIKEKLQKYHLKIILNIIYHDFQNTSVYMHPT